jgi:hypothetical protein
VFRCAVPHLDGGLIVSVKPDGCRIYPIDLQAAAAHWQALNAWWIARLGEKRAIGKPWAPRAAPADPDPFPLDVQPRLETLIAHAVDVATLNAIWALHSHEWQPHHTQLAVARKSALVGNQ